MKRNNKNSELVNRDILKEELKKERVITRGIIGEELKKERVITRGIIGEELKKEREFSKKELNSRFDSFSKAFRNEMKFMIEESEQRTQVKIQESESRIVSAIDPLLQELETRRQDRQIASHQSQEIQKQLTNHEKRIKKLEQN